MGNRFFVACGAVALSWCWRVRWRQARLGRPMRACRRPTASSRADGLTFIWKARPPTSAFSTDILLAPEIADAFEAIKLFDTHQTQRDWEFFRTTARADALAAHRRRVPAGIAGHCRWREGARRRSGRVRHRRAQRLRGSAGLLRAVAEQAAEIREGSEAGGARQLQRVHRHRQHDQRITRSSSPTTTGPAIWRASAGW